MAALSDVPASRWEGEAVEHWRRAWRIPDLRVFHSAGSTNDVLRTLADAGAPAGTTVLADTQSRGRGQHGRAWLAPPGKALLVSVLLRPDLAAGRIASPAVVPLRVGLAVARALERVAGVRPGIKWPNDLLLDGRKLAGILCEGVFGAGKAFVVAGIGVNVSQSPAELAAELRAPATSLRAAGARKLERSALAGAVIAAVAGLGAGAALPLSSAELEEFHARDVLLGREVVVDGEVEGTAAGIAPDGALLVERDGAFTAVRAGSIRPAGAATRDDASLGGTDS